MRLDLYCLMVKNGSLSEEVYTALGRAAHKLMREEGHRCRVKGPNFEGAVTTQHRSACIGGLAGVVFDATVDQGRRTIKVRYLCQRLRDDVPLDEIFLEPAEEMDFDVEEVISELGGGIIDEP